MRPVDICLADTASYDQTHGAPEVPLLTQVAALRLEEDIRSESDTDSLLAGLVVNKLKQCNTRIKTSSNRRVKVVLILRWS